MAKDLFTPMEANALYNRCKITYDPYAYSLRDSLKLGTSVGDLKRQHVSKVRYGAESVLVDLIHGFHKITGYANVPSIFEKTTRGADMECIDVQNTDAVFCKKDDLYIALDYLYEMGLSDSLLKKNRVLEAIVQVCIALSSSKSCCADLHWLACKGFETISYEDLHNFKPLTDAIAAKADYIPVNTTDTKVTAQFVPTWSYDTKGSSFITPTGLDKKFATLFDVETVATQMYYTFFYILEVLWALNSLPEKLIQDLAKTYVCTAGVVGSRTLSKLEQEFYTFSHTVMALNSEIESLISINSPKERFEAYRDYATRKDFKAKALEYADEFLKGSPDAIIPIGLGTFVGYAQTLSNTWVRVNSCKIMYEYAATNGLLDTAEYDDMEDFTAFDDLTRAAGADAMAFTTTATEKDSPDLMDLTVGHASVPKGGVPGASAYTSPTYEALDHVKAKFTDGRYEFNTYDKTDFSDAARARYEAIAKRVSLVNKVLTQKLREIKTYNTGGKCAGLPAGRLDRKAVYRYKHDSNIFYNNTYKQLESDLAFGVILDISGSMHGKGIENGRITMIVLHETLKALGINHSIIGHTSYGRYKCTIERYQSFREDKTYNTHKNYALAELESHSGNCDSASLWYMERALMRTKNRDKICVIFSDGQPTECTGTDLKDQVAHMERNGIKVIGIGIDFPEIADYYKDYANGKNLSDMLNIVTKILKEYILKKKECA